MVLAMCSNVSGGRLSTVTRGYREKKMEKEQLFDNIV